MVPAEVSGHFDESPPIETPQPSEPEASSNNGKTKPRKNITPANSARKKKAAGRKKAAAKLAEDGVPKAEIAEELGLKSVRQVNRYLSENEAEASESQSA